jgi:aldose 1-epimerase
MSEISSKTVGNVDGVPVHAIKMKNSSGVEITCLSYGATMTEVSCPDRMKNIKNVLLCANFSELIDPNNSKPKYVGTIGRVANRIAKGRFSLDGREFSLAVNNGENHLHGGIVGFDKKVWSFETLMGDNEVGVVFACTSPAMEEGYPGTLQVHPP